MKQSQLGLRIAIDRALVDHKLSMAQAAILETLAERGAMTCSEAIRNYAITQAVHAGNRDETSPTRLVAKSANAEDARHIVIDLTEEGQRAVRSCRKTVRDIEARMIRGFKQARSREISIVGEHVQSESRLTAQMRSFFVEIDQSNDALHEVHLQRTELGARPEHFPRP